MSQAIKNLLKIKLDWKVSLTSSLIFGANASLSVFLLYNHSIGLSNYVEKVWKRYQFGFPMSLNKKLAILAEQVLQDLGMEGQAHKIDFFPCTGCQPQTIGIYKLGKLSIGLPFYFDYKTVKNINKHEILMFGQDSPNWKSLDGKEFLKNLVLSDKAKKYAIAEQIKLGTVWTKNLLFDVGFFLAGVYSSFIYIRQEWYHQNKKKPMRASFRFAAAFGFAFMLYAAFILLCIRLEELHGNEALDAFLQQIKDNQEYVEGGLEYYMKMQKRNQIQRTFFGSDGRFYFKPNGNEIKVFSGKYSITEMIEKLSQIDRFDQSVKPKNEGEPDKIVKVTL